MVHCVDSDSQVVEPQDLCEMDGPVLHLLGETGMIPLGCLPLLCARLASYL